jgi:hypothetical protein
VRAPDWTAVAEAAINISGGIRTFDATRASGQRVRLVVVPHEALTRISVRERDDDDMVTPLHEGGLLYEVSARRNPVDAVVAVRSWLEAPDDAGGYIERATAEVIAAAYAWHEGGELRAEHRLRAVLERHQVALRAAAKTEPPPAPAPAATSVYRLGPIRFTVTTQPGADFDPTLEIEVDP